MLSDELEEKIFAQGYQAQHDGYRLRDNPYKRFSPEWEEWKNGHECSAKDDPYWNNVRKMQKKATKNLVSKSVISSP